MVDFVIASCFAGMILTPCVVALYASTHEDQPVWLAFRRRGRKSKAAILASANPYNAG